MRGMPSVPDASAMRLASPPVAPVSGFYQPSQMERRAGKQGELMLWRTGFGSSIFSRT